MVLYDISRELVKKGHNVYAAIPGPGPLKKFLQDQGITVYEWGPCKSYDLKGAIELYRFIKKMNIHIVHSHGMMVSIPARIAAWASRAKASVSTTHVSKGLNKKAGSIKDEIKRLYYVNADNFTARLANCNIAVSFAVRDDLIKQGMKSSLIRVIQNGIDFEKYALPCDIKDIQKIRVQCRARKNDILIGMAGRLTPQKGVDIFIRAAKEALEKKHNLKFAIAGSGPLFDELNSLAVNYELKDHFTFLGEINYMPAFLQALDIFALTSNREGLPLVVLEAMASGKPVTATAVDGTAEVVQPGINGYLFKKADFSGFADTWADMANNMNKAVKMGKNGQALAYQKYRAQRMVKDYIKLYMELNPVS
jgi:glycosyltransferase involved in cell wall biosynthesis